MQEDVIGFDVSVHDVAFGEDFEGLDHLAEEEEGFFLVEGALLLHEFVHGAAVAELVDEVEVVCCFEHVDVLDDVGAVL